MSRVRGCKVTLLFLGCFQTLFPVQKIEARVAADEDLKLADLLKYYLRESQAAKVEPSGQHVELAAGH